MRTRFDECVILTYSRKTRRGILQLKTRVYLTGSEDCKLYQRKKEEKNTSLFYVCTPTPNKDLLSLLLHANTRENKQMFVTYVHR